jgi:hypothetical protein
MKIEIKKYVDSITRYAAALAVAVGSLALTQSVHAQASISIEKKSLKILGIGNSFLKNATSMLPGIVKDSGHELILGVAAPGGRTIQNHYEAALLGETNPEDPKAELYEYNKQKMTLKEMLTAEKWDYVTIQQSSPTSFKIDTYRPYAQNLYDYIKKYASQAEVVFHQTWAWRPDHNRMNMDKNPPGFMYQELTRNYNTIAKEIGIKKIIPVGNAFQLAEETPEWKFARDPDFDYNNPKYPELPKEPNSLNGGFAWRGTDGADKVFKLDGSHASGAGSYLAACVWYEFFFGGDVRKITRNPGFLGERAASLREFAHQAVNGARPKAWPSDTTPKKTTLINQ